MRPRASTPPAAAVDFFTCFAVFVAQFAASAGCATSTTYPVPPVAPAPTDPWSWGHHEKEKAAVDEDADGPAMGAINLYRRYLRRDGFMCRMAPSCSAF